MPVRRRARHLRDRDAQGRRGAQGARSTARSPRCARTASSSGSCARRSCGTRARPSAPTGDRRHPAPRAHVRRRACSWQFASPRVVTLKLTRARVPARGAARHAARGQPRLRRGAAARARRGVYIELFRGTPVLLQLFVLYYGLARRTSASGRCRRRCSASASTTARTRPRSIAAPARDPARPERGGARARHRAVADAAPRAAAAGAAARAAADDERLRVAAQGLLAGQRDHRDRADQADDDRRGRHARLARPGHRCARRSTSCSASRCRSWRGDSRGGWRVISVRTLSKRHGDARGAARASAPTSPRARRSRSSGRRAAASRRCCAASTTSRASTRATVEIAGFKLRPGMGGAMPDPARAAHARSGWCSSSSTCSRT